MGNSASPAKDLESRKDGAATITTGSVEEIGAEAKAAIEHEHELTFLQAMKLYPTAARWSTFFSLGIVITAFDPQLLGNLYATPAVQRDFGLTLSRLVHHLCSLADRPEHGFSNWSGHRCSLR